MSDDENRDLKGSLTVSLIWHALVAAVLSLVTATGCTESADVRRQTAELHEARIELNERLDIFKQYAEALNKRLDEACKQPAPQPTQVLPSPSDCKDCFPYQIGIQIKDGKVVHLMSQDWMRHADFKKFCLQAIELNDQPLGEVWRADEPRTAKKP